MNSDSKNNLYSIGHYSVIDKITIKKRFEIIDIIKKNVPLEKIENVLDVGTTKDEAHYSSNLIIKNLGNFREYKSISDQKINSSFFSKCIQKSITDELSLDNIQNLKADLVICNATIEHVGSLENQVKMCENIIKLSNKYFIISTPNRYHPIEFHTKIPFLHFLPKNIHRFILKLIGLDFFSKEANLNLLSYKNLMEIMKKVKHQNFKIKSINLFFFKSNLILIGKK